MPEVQFFGLPTETINTGAVAAVSFLKAEDAAGNLHDILGSPQRLPHYNFWSGWWSGSTTSFRLYAGTFQHIKPTDRRLYLSIQNTSGTMTTSQKPCQSQSSGLYCWWSCRNGGGGRWSSTGISEPKTTRLKRATSSATAHSVLKKMLILMAGTGFPCFSRNQVKIRLSNEMQPFPPTSNFV